MHLFGEQREHSFREAAAKFLAENQLQAQSRARSSERSQCSILSSARLPLQRVHHDTLAPYIRFRLDKGRSPGTINRDLAVVRRILNLAARLWRDETDRPWLPVAPLIQMQRHPHRARALPAFGRRATPAVLRAQGHLASMALFKVNTGLREQEVVNLRWQWESNIPELGTSIFVIPRDYVKNGS